MTEGPTPPPEVEKVATDPPKNRGGRPTKLTPAVQEEICRAIAASGAPLIDACRLAGVDYSSLKRWIQKGKAQRRGKFRAFLAAVERARSEDKVASLARITQAGRGTTTLPADWRADAWKLERSHQGEYSQRVYVHVEAQLKAGLERLREAFDGLPEGRTLTKEEAFEFAIDALAGDRGAPGAGPLADGEDPAADSAGGEAVRAAPTEPEAASVPEPERG